MLPESRILCTKFTREFASDLFPSPRVQTVEPDVDYPARPHDRSAGLLEQDEVTLSHPPKRRNAPVRKSRLNSLLAVKNQREIWLNENREVNLRRSTQLFLGIARASKKASKDMVG